MATGPSPVEVGRRVSVLRHAKRMTQDDLARLSQVSRNTIGQVECGRPSTVRVMQKICAALGVKIGDVLDGQLPRVPEARTSEKQ